MLNIHLGDFLRVSLANGQQKLGLDLAVFGHDPDDFLFTDGQLLVGFDLDEDYLHFSCVVFGVDEVAKKTYAVGVSTFLLVAVRVQVFRKFFDLFVLEGGEEDPKLCVAVDFNLFVDAYFSQF